METLMAFVIGGLFAAGLYMMLRRSIVKLIIGMALIGHSANLLIFTVSGLVRGEPPLVAFGHYAPAALEPFGQYAPPGVVADPLPQALILTAIVINFGVIAFALALVHRVYQTTGSDDVDDMTTTDT